MTDITIPPAALEAAARAIAEYYTSKEWSDINQGSKNVWRSSARASCLAMLKAWPGMGIEVARDESEAIILPLPKENTND